MSNASVDAQATETGAQPLQHEHPVGPIGTTRLVVLAGLAFLADWLFYLRPVGISVPLFVLAIAFATAIANPVRTSRTRFALAAAMVAVACVPLFLTPTALAVLVALSAAAYFAVSIAAQAPLNVKDAAHGCVGLVQDCGWRLFADLVKWPWPKRAGNVGARLMSWVVPLLLGGIFLLLFAAANPLIETWLRAVDPWAATEQIEVLRVGFWLFVAVMVWPFVFVRVRAGALGNENALWEQPPSVALDERLFGKPALLRSLILFNALFAVETGLDVA